jgi:hypothetical protein
MIESVPQRVICDAGPVIHRDEFGCIDLLSSFSRVLVPVAVWQEVQRHRPIALALTAWTVRRLRKQSLLLRFSKEVR